MKVIASFPELEPVPAPTRALIPASTPVPVKVEAVSPKPMAPHASPRFPLRSVVALAVLASLSWAGAWWNDHTRARAERMAVTRSDDRAVAGRPNRLARELPASDSAAEVVAP